MSKNVLSVLCVGRGLVVYVSESCSRRFGVRGWTCRGPRSPYTWVRPFLSIAQKYSSQTRIPPRDQIGYLRTIGRGHTNAIYLQACHKTSCSRWPDSRSANSYPTSGALSTSWFCHWGHEFFIFSSLNCLHTVELRLAPMVPLICTQLLVGRARYPVFLSSPH